MFFLAVKARNQQKPVTEMTEKLPATWELYDFKIVAGSKNINKS